MIDISKGCYTRLDRLTEGEYQDVCEAIIQAGGEAGEYDRYRLKKPDCWAYVGVDDDLSIVHWDSIHSFGSQAVEYTKEEILSSIPGGGLVSTKPEGGPKPDQWKIGDKFVCPQIPEDPYDTAAGWGDDMDSLVGDTLEVTAITSEGYLKAQGWHWQTDWVYKVNDGAVPVHDFMEEELFEDPELSIEEEKRDVDIMESIRRACGG